MRRLYEELRAGMSPESRERVDACVAQMLAAYPWIPVSCSLPETPHDVREHFTVSDDVFVVLSGRRVTTGRYGSDGYWDAGGAEYASVLYWMPIPELPPEE